LKKHDKKIIMKSAITIFIIITAGLSLISAIGQLLVRKRKLMNYSLSALSFCMTILQVQAVALITGIGFSRPILFFFNTTALYLLGVLRYFAYFLISLRWEDMPGKKILYFIPSCLALVFDLYYLVLPEADKIQVITDLLSGVFHGQGVFIKFILAGAGIQATVYWSVLLAIIIKGRRAGKPVILSGISISYSVLSIIGINILGAGFIVSSINLIIISSVMLGFMIIGTFLVYQMNPEFMQKTMFPGTKKRYVRSRLTGLETEDLHRRVMELIEKEKVYANEEITLTDFADELSITPHQLSEFLNERLNCNFYSFINQHRIKEAVRIITEDPKRTIQSIVHRVGFNSKSSFYDSFSRFMGMTPNKYRSKLLKKE
jgi:AraC-like DNA-binding protein